MKRLVVVGSLMAATAFLFVSGNVEDNDTTEQVQHTKLTRVKNASGLEYEILQEGSGAMPEVGRGVTVHYTCWLDNNGEPGKQFASSVDRGQPFSFKMGSGNVIPGWNEGIITMKVGEKRRIFVPSHLGNSVSAAANENFIYDVELISTYSITPKSWFSRFWKKSGC